MLETLIASAGIPIISDIVKRLATKFIGPAVDSEADTKKLKALSELDDIGDTYKWVNAIRGLMRPAACVIALSVWSYASFTPTIEPHVYDVISQVAGAVVFYLFGERTVMYARRRT